MGTNKRITAKKTATSIKWAFLLKPLKYVEEINKTPMKRGRFPYNVEKLNKERD